jgi:hypothetical protein
VNSIASNFFFEQLPAHALVQGLLYHSLSLCLHVCYGGLTSRTITSPKFRLSTTRSSPVRAGF